MYLNSANFTSEGRFVTKGPIGFRGGQTNLYGYVMNDQVNLTDPTGLFTEGWLASFLTPGQQGALGGIAVYIGQALIRYGLGASATGVGTLPATVILGLGGTLVFEGGTNLATATIRAYQNLPVDPFNNVSAVSTPILPFVPSTQQLVCRK